MVPSSLDGLTDEQLAELEAQQGQPEITTGLVDRLAASPAPAQGFTDQQLDALPALASTPFARERGIALPPEAPAEPEPMTDYELNQLEEENYRRVDYIMPQEEFRQYWTRRKEENNEVGRFIDGVGQGAAAMIGMLPQAANEITDALITGVKDPLRQAERNLQTGAEIVRKAGINMVQLFDWVGNKANDAATWAKRRGLKQQALAKRLEQEGKLTGDELRDANIIAAAASEADAMEPMPVEEEEDFDKAYERYQREKALEQEFAGVTDFQIGASKVSAPAATKEAYQITDEQPAETLSMIGSMVVDPVNLIPVGAGALSKLRVLRRTATLAGAPLRGVQRAADATADLAERAEFGISSRVQDITGLTAKQQAALGAGAAGAAVYADAAGGGGNVTAAVTAIGSVLPGLRYGGAIIRKTGAAAGGAATIIREAGVGGIGTARAEAAADLARMTAIPERYRKYFTGYVDGTDSTLKRVAQDAGNPEALRRVARFADRAGVTTAARLADDVTSGAVAAGITGAPFAALQPDAERAGEVLGGIMALGGVAGVAGSVARRGATEADADIARMMADVYAVGGNIDGFSQLPHATLDRLAAMQGMLASKVDFVPLRADEYRKNKDTSEVGGELSAGLFLEKDANNRARIYINLDARPGQGGAAAIAPHEIGHAILTSNVLDGQPRNDLRNLVNQQYGVEGVTARGREYVTRLVDGDIQNGTTGELPQVLTEQEFRDLESGNKSAADISKARKLEPSERERLINERYEELSQRSIERGEDALDWARDEIIAETFASEAPAIDFRAIRRDAAFPRLAESMLATGGRVLEMMGVRLDSGTGKMLDNPSVLFRDNPLFQDRIMQKRVKEYVRAYDQYLVGLEEAGSATPRGVELARSSRPEDMARSTHVKLRDEGRGVLENDFLFQKPDGTYAYKPQPIINAAEANRAAQIKTLYDAKKFVPVNSTEFGKRKVNGREVIGGPVLPPQFDLFTQFPQHVREFARAMEASRAEGGSWNIDYNAIGTGSSGRYRITNMGAVRAIQRETVPFGWQVTKQNHLLAASLDLNAFRASAMKAINKGELGIFNNDMKQVEADLKTYLANHRNGMPGEATIGQQKRDTLNGLIGTGTAVQRAANPLYAELNPKGSIRTWRIDRLNDAQPSGRTGYFFDYDKINNNRMPQQIPRSAQGMPDAVDALTTDQLLRQYEENQGYLGLSTLGMREGRPVRGGAAQTRELLRRNEAISAELERRGVREEDPQLQRALQRRGQAMPDAQPADFAQPSITDGPLEVEDSPLRISTRTPSAKAATENPLTSQLSIDTAAIANAGALAKTTGIIAQYPGIRFASKNPEGRAQEFIRFAADNLLWLHDQVPADIRPRSSLWYDGARNISVRWSGEYGIPRQGNAAAIAALSPQKDWYMNVSLARRVLEMVTKNQDRVFGDAEMQWAKQRMKQAAPIQKMLAGIKGKRFADMTTYEKAVFSRAFDEINNPRGYEILSPEGEFIGPATNKDGSPSRVAWGDFNSIAKAVTVSEDPRAEVISRALGEEHKVRSFYNNIILPNYARFGDVTIDTHAVAGALLRPLAGSDTPVLHNFGGSGAGGSAITGHSGTYGLYADAYRLAASERGILPRQMQSITWEAVRGLFSPEWKTASNKALVDKVWTQYKKGEIDINETRKQISDSAGGIAAPSWYRPNP
jgi:hypothetical protein